MNPPPIPSISLGDHKAFMQHALSLARLSPSLPTNFRVGALLVDNSTGVLLSTGYTLELPGNTHAEQCCLQKLALEHGVSEDELEAVLPEHVVLYTTVEPCMKRLSGNLPCLERVLKLKKNIKVVVVGTKEPDTFVKGNSGLDRLRREGIEVIVVEGMEEEVLEVAMAGHTK